MIADLDDTTIALASQISSIQDDVVVLDTRVTKLEEGGGGDGGGNNNTGT